MTDQKKNVWLKTLIIVVIVLLIPKFFQLIGGHDVEKVREKMKEELYEEYGEEFMVDRIGTRTAGGDKFYTARIYPKSIIGTPKENDKYYYGKASVDIKGFRLSGVADTYGEINRSIEIEHYLLSKIKELFGKRVLLKVDQRYEKREEGGYFISYLNPNFKEVMTRIKDNPKNHRLKLELYLYIFDRIDDEDEKEERRKQIFDFVQYLKEEDLFKYLEMGVIFIDERVLAPSYDKYKRKISLSEKEEKEVCGETVYLPPMELRKEMSIKLHKEIIKMSEEKLMGNMKEIRKSRLTYKGIRKNNADYICRITSMRMLIEKYTTFFEKNPNSAKEYNTLEEILVLKNLEYVYLRRGKIDNL